MNFSMQNKALNYAVLVSILIHGLLMFVRFVPPGAFHIVPPDPTLEVVLVNAKSKSVPLNPQAVAQANLDGGGGKTKEIPKSPLPDSKRVSEGDVLASSERRIEELQKEQKQLAAKLKEELKTSIPEAREKTAIRENADASVRSQTDSQQAIASQAAAIERNMEEQGNRPKVVRITPRTREVGYAMYYKSMQRKIENVGTLNFPQRNGRKLYGELMIYIPVYQDGTLYEKEGGPRVEKSSGNPALDNAALRIVRRAAPFGPFPPKMLSGTVREVWVIVTRFRFTRDEALETDSGG
ncbi:TonB family protein [Oxalobacter sp. OttesenSCG-928-P03]|nr:TonB family protein [Oxalobacter sp. OttesenSCG-928-P03]